VRAISLHPDVLVVTSALLALNCVIVRGGEGERAETFVVDSPLLPEELDALPALIDQARFPAPSGLLATHGDWDHLLGRLAFPDVALGCAASTVERLRSAPGEAQRELRAFDEQLMIERSRPLSLGSLQGLPIPGSCEIGECELELHPACGHVRDGMAIVIQWAQVFVVGDYLSAVEIPTLSEGGDLEAYLDTLARLRPLAGAANHVVPGHGPVLDGGRALVILDEDLAYLHALAQQGRDAPLPQGRNRSGNRGAHLANVRAIELH
jgi:glyoxylase-like metal-dependent hydrolase (beta-lactamase superfamily II)